MNADTKHNIYLIYWINSSIQINETWKEIAKIKDQSHPNICKSTGFLLDEDESWITLGQSVREDEAQHAISIYKKSILKIIGLGNGDKNEIA